MEISYKANDPKGWGGDPSRGAALGRPSIHDAASSDAIKLHLRRVRLDSGGYDPNGTYFGHGERLYWYASDCGSVDAMLRAPSREAAKARVRALYPKARFFR